MASFKSCTSLVLFLALLSLASAEYITYEPTTPATPTYEDEATPYAPTYPEEKQNYCPINVLKFGVCANILRDIRVELGVVPSDPYCCPLIEGLVDLEAAACLCTACKANVLGVPINVNLELELLFNSCGYEYPTGYECSSLN